MANSYDTLQAEPKLRTDIIKSAFSFTVANRWYSTLTAAGIPDPGTSSLSVQATGAVLTRATAGFPNPLTTNRDPLTGYVTLDEIGFAASISATGPVVRAKLFEAYGRYGTYAFNANTSVTDAVAATTGYSGYLWLEVVTAVTGTLQVAVTASNGPYNITITGSPAAGTFWPFPQTGSLDEGASVYGITQVQAATASAGSFNLWLVRPFWSGAVGPGMPQLTRARSGLNELGLNGAYVNADAAVLPLVRSTATGTVPLEFELVTSRSEF